MKARLRITHVAFVALSVTLLPFPQAVAATGGPVGSTPAGWTPSLATSGTDGTVEQIRQLAQCNDTMYAVGRFTRIKQNETDYNRSNAFSFSATTGALTTWDPSVNGQVNSVAVSPDCATAYLGGNFTSVSGTAVENLAAISTSTGEVKPGFAHTAGARVNALILSGNHLLVGGNFKSINGSTKKYMVSLDPDTGTDDGYVDLGISGKYVYTDDGGRAASGNSTHVYNYALSLDDTKLLVMGVFTSVGGLARRQIFMLDLESDAARVDPWYSPEFDQNCATVQPFWLRDASWSPDGSNIYVATTGYKPANGLGYHTWEPRAGLCDVVAAFSSLSASDLGHLWVNYTGCDSLYSTAADANTVYAGGHERWASNPLGCDGYLTPGASRVGAPGMVGLSPEDGGVTFNPTRGRGMPGADDMIVTSAGLWIASDNGNNTNKCAGVSGHAGLCFLAY